MNRPDEKHLELIWRHVTGAGLPGEDETLARLIAAHPEYANALYMMADERLALETVMRTGSSCRLLRRRPRTREAVSRGNPAGLVAAAVVLSAITAFFLLNRREKPVEPIAITASREQAIPPGDPPAPPGKPGAVLRPVRLLDRLPEREGTDAAAPGERTNPGMDTQPDKIEASVMPTRRAVVEALSRDATADEARTETDRIPPRISAPPATVVTRPKDMQIPVAVLDFCAGRIVMDGPDGPQKARKGQPLMSGSSVRTGPAPSRVLLRFQDGTRIDLLPGTEVLAPSDPSDTLGRRLFVRRGRIRSDVAPQPSGRPLVFAASAGEAQVLGTTLRLDVQDGESGAIQLEVLSGKVRLVRDRDGRSIDVAAGHFAEIDGEEATFRPRRVVTVSFQDGVAPTKRYAGTRDTTIVEYAEGARRNFGRGTSIWADGDTSDMNKPTLDKSALLRWDLTAIPRNARIIWAEIAIDVVNDSRGNPFGMHALRRPWEEMQATWHSPLAGAAWEVPGAQGEQDRDPALLGQFTAGAGGPHEVIFTREGILAVQAWIDQPARNFGLIAADTRNGDALGFSSREASPPTARPRLTLSFVAR